MPRGYTNIQIADWDQAQLENRLDYINAHLDNGGRFSHRNGVELLQIAERALELAREEKGFE